MKYTIQCTFAAGAYARAKGLRLEHYAFLREVRQAIVEGGPLLGPDNLPTGMLLVVEGESEEAARLFIQREPYTANGLFERLEIRRWAQVIPEPRAGYIEDEYKKELSARAAGA
jgi:uncharacterized protein YciI